MPNFLASPTPSDSTVQQPSSPSLASTAGNIAISTGVKSGINAGIDAAGGLPGGAGLGGITAGAYTGYLQGQGIYDAMQGKPMSWPSKIALALPTFGVSLFADNIPGFTHETTAQHEANAWHDLATSLGQDSGTQQALNTLYGANHPTGDTGIWSSGPNAGKQWNFADANNAAKTGNDFAGVLGDMQAIPDWLSNKYTADQRTKISQAAAQQGLYSSKYGDVLVNDPTKFNNIASQVLAGTYVAPQPTPPTLTDHVFNALAANNQSKGNV